MTVSQNLYRTPYGDMAMRITPLSGSHTYKLRFRDIMTGANILRDITSSTVQADGYVWLDYPVDQSLDDYGIAYPPQYANWELYVDNVLDQTSGGGVAVAVSKDNTVVKKRIGFIGQSNAEQHFSYLSNGYTHIGHASATTFRNEYAAALGLRPVTVHPINLAVGGSGAHAGSAPSYAPHYYWWDIVNNVAGPCYAGFAGDNDATPENAIAAIATRLADNVATGVSVKLDALVISHGEQDAVALTSATDWRTAWDAVIAQLKTDCGNASLPVYWQALGRLWMNMAGTPFETNGAYTKAIRDQQIDHATDYSWSKVGAWSGATSTSALYDGVHYQQSTYHDIAEDLAAQVAAGTSLEGSIPSWATYSVPTVSSAKQPNGDIIYTFGNLINGEPYRWRHDQVESPYYAISTSDFTASGTSYTYTWTLAAQKAAYANDYGAGYVNVRCARWESSTDFGGNGQYVGAA